MLPGERRTQPVPILSPTSRHDRLVHQVVAEDRRAVLALTRDRFPKLALSIPAILLGQIVESGDLTLKVPAGTGSGKYALVSLYSYRTTSDYHLWPVAIVVR